MTVAMPIEQGCSGSEAIRTAHATLARGGIFFAIGIGPSADAKVLGNALRELDGFLNHLISEVAAAYAPALSDHRGFRWRRDAAARLHALNQAMALPGGQDQRLRAIGRVRACLFHCGGTIHAPGLLGDLEMATGRSVADRAASLIALSAADRAALRRFYEHIGAELMDACRGRIAHHPSPPRLSRRSKASI